MSEDSGFGSLDPVRFVRKDEGVILIQYALDIDPIIAEYLWDKWSEKGPMIPADRLGRRIFFYDRDSN